MHLARPLAAAVLASVVAAAACTGDDGAPPPPPITDPPATATATTTTVPVPSPNDPLTLGVLLPRDPDDELAESLRFGVEEALQDARGAGAEIRVLEVDEGESPEEAEQAIRELISEGADAVVGPSSSLIALDSLGILVEAGIPTCSPTASSLLLDDYPDDDMFMRTIPSDSLQASAIAQVAAESGASEVAIAYVDDHYGRGLNRATVEAVSGDLRVVAQVAIPDDEESLPDAVAELVADRPPAVILLADDVQGPRFLQALGDHVGDHPATLPDLGIIVNDALRRPVPADAIANLDDALRDGIRGTSPAAVPTSSGSLSQPYSLYAYNCVTALALGWHVAGVQGRHLSVPLVVEITSSGASCTSYGSCVASASDRPNIRYSGPGGRLHLGPDGDPSEATFDVFRFDGNGNDVPDGTNVTIVVSR